MTARRSSINANLFRGPDAAVEPELPQRRFGSNNKEIAAARGCIAGPTFNGGLGEAWIETCVAKVHTPE
jgi:hypothetical protein